MLKQEFLFQNQKIVFEKGEVATNAGSSCVIRWNNTVILVTMCVSDRPIDSNFVPLSIDFQENLFSVGKIPGSFARREGKPSDFAVLSGRLIDRSIRNLFPKDFRHEVQIFINPLAYDYSINLTVVSLLATSFVLNNSSLPIDTLFAGVVVGYINDQFVLNPSAAEMEESKLEMFLSGNENMITMIEVSAHELSEDKVLQAIKFGHEQIKQLINHQKDIFRNVSLKKKLDYQKVRKATDLDFTTILQKNFLKNIENLVLETDAPTRNIAFAKLQEEVLTFVSDNYDATTLSSNWKNETLDVLTNLICKKVRTFMIENKKRMDGREFHDLREVKAQIDYLPQVHGSGLFSRGVTQTLSVVTLGPLNKNKLLDDLTTEDKSYFLHHYKFLPFATGSVQKRFNLSRREVGHGFLGYKALLPLLPALEDFPYTIRVASEILSADGSTSQASICSASLALFGAGVPLKNPVAGIAVGLLKENDEYHLLSDIQAWEDFYGDMDFKIAGTIKGVCSMQLDLKIEGLPITVIEKILVRGYKDRCQILKIMDNVIAKPRASLATHAIKFKHLQIAEENVSLLIGPSGRNIKKLIIDFENPEIDIQNDGRILLYHKDEAILQRLEKHIFDMFKPVKVGDTFDAFVSKITDYGIFIKTKDRNVKGLIHISSLNKNDFSRNSYKTLRMNQKIVVQVISINEKKQINFSLLRF